MFILGIFVPMWIIWGIISFLILDFLYWLLSGVFSRRVHVKTNPLILQVQHKGVWYNSLEDKK